MNDETMLDEMRNLYKELIVRGLEHVDLIETADDFITYMRAVSSVLDTYASLTEDELESIRQN